jgi:hypothetical protein
MTKYQRKLVARELMANGIRWASNILVELLGQHGEFCLTDKGRDLMLEIEGKLDDLEKEIL